jgi:hypothetical protein
MPRRPNLAANLASLEPRASQGSALTMFSGV